MGEPDGIVGRNFVEVGCSNVTVIGKFAFVPAGAPDPFAGLGSGNFFAYEFDGFSDGFDVAELDGIKLVSCVEVAMGVDKTGGGGAAVQVDEFGVFRSVGANFFVRADGNDFAIVDGNGLGDGIMRIDGDDFAVDEDKVGFGRRLGVRTAS